MRSPFGILTDYQKQSLGKKSWERKAWKKKSGAFILNSP
jgi:hypothetical protein